MEPVRDRKGKLTLDAHVMPDEELVLVDAEKGEYGYERVKTPDDPAVQAAHTQTVTRAEARKRILTQKALVMLSEGERMLDVATMVGVSVSTLTGWIARHKQRVKMAEIDGRIDQIALPIATDNLIHGLLAGDKDYTLETLKGRGVFRRHSDANIKVPESMPDLVVRFETPPAAAGFGPHDIAMGKIVGRAALPAPVTEGQQLDQRVLDAVYEVEQIHGQTHPPPANEAD